MTLAELAAVLAAVTLVVAGQVTLKWGMELVGPITGARLRQPFGLLGDVASHWQVWVGSALYVTSAAAWIYALSTVPLSVAYPFLGLTYVGVAAIAVTVFGEWLTPAQWIGIALVVAGVVTVALTAGAA
jgi:multidrug transporter EmrE-like cation transporter